MDCRFTLMLGLGGYQDYAVLAQAAEAAGWHALSVPDSLFFPLQTDSDYPYADTEAVRSALEVTPVIEPLIAIAGMAALTQRIRFYPGVLKVPVRQPLVLAKALGSLAVMSDNRISLGAGLSPWQEDFTYNGVPFAGRGRRMDECLEIIRLALAGDYFDFHGEYYQFGSLKLVPAPTEPVPILLGGHSEAALRRAARLGDGWISANTDLATLRQLIGQLQELRRESGRESANFQIHALDSGLRTAEDCQALIDIGVTDICVTPWNPYASGLNLDAKLKGIRDFAGQVKMVAA